MQIKYFFWKNAGDSALYIKKLTAEAASFCTTKSR
jgi:hypothetical protein